MVSSGTYHRKRPDLIIMAITSQRHSATFGETTVAQWQAAGLLRPSILNPLLATVEQRSVRRKLGRLPKDDLTALRQALDTILGS